MTDEERNRPHFETLCAHFAEDPSKFHGAVIPPIFQNSLFTFPTYEERATNYQLEPTEIEEAAGGVSRFYDYTRVTNPTTDIVERKIAALEGAEMARCFASGMGAIAAAIFSCVRAGAHVIAPQTVYGPTRQLLQDYLKRFQVSVTFVDGADPADYEGALRPETTLLYLESPSTVVMRQQDLEAVAQIAKRQGAATICDNSWASPYFQNPLHFGVDLVVHSATKYLGGHSDIVAGVVAGSRERIHRLAMEECCLLGATLDPFAAWLLLRGIRTLPIRMERHQQNAKAIASWLCEHPAVAEVYYPGLPGDPQASLTAKQLRGTSGLLSLRLKRSTREAAARFVNRLRYFQIGCSWGGFESLALPMALPAERVGGVPGETLWFVRLHIGQEHLEDLQKDLDQALRED
jgi:cystathionine beta-lyase